MVIEVWVVGASWVTAAVAVGGVIVTWRHNGRNQAKRDERLELNQENIIKKLDDPKHGLAAIDDKVNNMVNHCATVSTGLTERMITAERDIKEVKAKNKAP
ncbi:hypothetical protein ES703_72739 [subsurface metagenome]